MNRKISTLWTIVGLLSSLSWAQTWRGGEAVAIQVNDAKGRAVPGARVVFTFQGMPGDLGPDIVATDSKGRAVVAELAPGPWQVEIVHPDYLSFIAMLDVRRGKKPLISASFLQAGGRSLNPVKVKFSKGDERQASPVFEARATPEPVETEATVAAKPAPAVTEAAEEPEVEPMAVAVPESVEPVADLPSVPEPEPSVAESAVPEAGSRVEEPEVAPTPDVPAEVEVTEITRQPAVEERESTASTAEDASAASAAAAAAAAATAATSRAAESGTSPSSAEQVEVPEPETAMVAGPPSEPATPETPTPEVETAPVTADLPEEIPAAEPPAPQPEPAVEAVVEATEEAAPPTPEPVAPVPPAVAAAAVAAPPDPGIRVTSHRDGSCSDCQTAEWTLQVSAEVPAASSQSDGTCDPGILDTAQPVMREMASSIQLELQGFIGPLANGTSQEAVRQAEPDLVAPFQGPLAAFVGGVSPCQIVGLVLPREVRFSRVTYGAADQEGSGACVPGQECPIGEAAWLGSARVERGPSSTVVYGLFENGSSRKGRRAFLTAFYRPPSARWQPRLPAAD